MARHDRSARGEALRKLIRVDGRVRPKRTLELLAERFPAQAAVHLELLAEEIEDKGDISAQELGLLLGRTEISLLRTLILEHLIDEGLVTADGKEHPLFRTFKSLDNSLCQWLRIHLSVPVQSTMDSPIAVSELWNSALKPPTSSTSAAKLDSIEDTDSEHNVDSKAPGAAEADNDNNEADSATQEAKKA